MSFKLSLFTFFRFEAGGNIYSAYFDLCWQWLELCQEWPRSHNDHPRKCFGGPQTSFFTCLQISCNEKKISQKKLRESSYFTSGTFLQTSSWRVEQDWTGLFEQDVLLTGRQTRESRGLQELTGTGRQTSMLRGEHLSCCTVLTW